jgi:hypothetical protein
MTASARPSGRLNASGAARRNRYARSVTGGTAKVLTRLPSIAAIVALVCVVATGNRPLAQPLVLLSVMLAPVLLPRKVLYPRRIDPPPDQADGGGGGEGPEPERPRPSPDPGGGLPLPDAAPAKVRRRDHHPPGLTPRRSRRPAREPAIAPRPGHGAPRRGRWPGH